MTPPPPRSKRTNTLLPYPTLFRSIAVTNLDEVVRIIRGSPSPVAAREALLAREWPVAEIAPFIRLVEAIEHEVEGETYKLSDLQVRAILDLRLHRLTALGRDEIGNELQGLANNIAEYLAILRSEEHTSALQSLMRISYAVFCLKKK